MLRMPPRQASANTRRQDGVMGAGAGEGQDLYPLEAQRRRLRGLEGDARHFLVWSCATRFSDPWRVPLPPLGCHQPLLRSQVRAARPAHRLLSDPDRVLLPRHACDVWQSVAEMFALAGIETDCHQTQHAGHAREILRCRDEMRRWRGLRRWTRGEGREERTGLCESIGREREREI
eukprot:766674-Hanusia_phi.AAC.2